VRLSAEMRDWPHREAFRFRMTRTALEAFHDKTGVCRDYTHLAVGFCRGMNIPARYCTGYLGDIGVPPPHGTPDFAAWFEAFLDGHWYTSGPSTSTTFKVWTDEVGKPLPMRVS